MASKMKGYVRKPKGAPKKKPAVGGPERPGGRGAAVASKAPGRTAPTSKVGRSSVGVGTVRKPSVSAGARSQNRVASGSYKAGPAKQPTLRAIERKKA